MNADFNDTTRIPSTDWRAYRGVLSRRIFAFLIDYAIIALLWIPAAVVVFFLGILTLGLGFFLYPALFAIVAMAYFGLTMGGPSQASVGMNVMGLKLARVDGRPIDILTAVVHLVLFWIGNALLTPFIVLIGLFTDRGRLLHDLLLGTVMMRRDVL
ncbi:RDD family protein [Shinella daejeonensis]|uniref:RDD family protein n=1 Tax=Shinella daejeonensis TaxID=659017 RepID=UPI0020C813A0|nr:RDD family protein [Shinella daejeonensis]MCP8895651.1 RDD family protein [Shinella daejeonensis]